MTEWYKKGDLDFSKIHTVNLDEYKGIDAENKQSYHYFMNQHLFSRVNIELQNTFVPDGMNENQDEECQRYEKLIAGLGGVDLQLLGLAPSKKTICCRSNHSSFLDTLHKLHHIFIVPDLKRVVGEIIN